MRLRDSVFEQHQIKAMSAAFDEVCEALKLDDDSSAKRVMAGRIIDSADPLAVQLDGERRDGPLHAG